MSQATAIALPVRQNTPAWVDARRDFIGSSDLPILTGNSPYGTSVFSLWAYKTRLAEPDPIDPETQELFDLGHALEDDIAERYTLRTGRPLRIAAQMRSKRDLPWASANLDRVSARKGERRIVEVKWVPNRNWLTEGSDPVPSYVLDQVQWQLYVLGYDVADVVVLLGSKVYIHENIGPDYGHQDDLLYIANWFRELIDRGEAPPVDHSEATRIALQRLHPRETADLLPASLETDAIAEDYRIARALAKAAEKKQAQVANAIRLMLGDHAGVQGRDYRISWLKNKDGSRTDWQAIAAAQRKLLDLVVDAGLGKQLTQKLLAREAAKGGSELIPAGTVPLTLEQLLEVIESLHTTPTEDARVLRAYFKDDEKGTWT